MTKRKPKGIYYVGGTEPPNPPPPPKAKVAPVAQELLDQQATSYAEVVGVGGRRFGKADLQQAAILVAEMEHALIDGYGTLAERAAQVAQDALDAKDAELRDFMGRIQIAIEGSEDAALWTQDRLVAAVTELVEAAAALGDAIDMWQEQKDMLDEQAAALRQVTRCCSSCAAWAPRNKGDRTGECRSPRGPAAGLVTQADEWCDRWTGP